MGKDKSILLRRHKNNNDLLSALGADLKETRITGYLAYLIYLRSPHLLKTLKIDDKIIQVVNVEYHLETQRCDIVVVTENTDYIIEAKLFYENPIQQLEKQEQEYRKNNRKRIKLIGITNNKIVKSAKCALVSWGEICRSLESNGNSKLKILNEELKMHLINKGLAKEEAPDIYAREVGNDISILMFLKGQTYTCPYPKSSQIEKCKYFAPHFSKKITKIIPGINYGISYLSQISTIEYVDNKKDWEKVVQSHFKSKKLRRPFPEAKKYLLNIKFDFSKPHMILLLNRPHLIFNPPIQKDKLQEGKGWLSKQYFTFENFFNASRL